MSWHQEEFENIDFEAVVKKEVEEMILRIADERNVPFYVVEEIFILIGLITYE